MNFQHGFGSSIRRLWYIFEFTWVSFIVGVDSQEGPKGFPGGVREVFWCDCGSFLCSFPTVFAP